MGNATVLLGSNALRDMNAGVAGTVLELGESLARHGWQPHYEFARLSSHPRRERQMAYFRMVSAVAKVKPAAAIIGSADGVLIPFIRPGLPLVVHSHGLEHMARAAFDSLSVPHTFGRGHRYIREPAVKLASRRADALVVQTQSQADFAIEHFGARPDRVHVIPNSVDSSFFLVEAIDTPRPIVVWVGSWLPGKGSEWVPRVFADLRLRRPDAVLHLVGTGAAEEVVRDSFAYEDREGLVVTPRASRMEVRSALAEARVGLFTSAFEGFGRAPLEMAAAGLPVVSTKAGVAGEIVERGVSGEVVAFGEVGAAVDALERYLSDESVAVEHGRNARSAARRFERERIGAQWNGLLQSLVRGS